ncbi:MAG: VWA domain-containing protein [Acidobacteria bacterium]|nr:VWA domain-containing protein [Acidobacteriota bacterium]
MPICHYTFPPLKVLVLATLFCSVIGAQNNQTQQPKPATSKNQDALRIETELVQIDAVVTDKQGKLVPDLKREDFELYEDGKKQSLTHFAIGTAKQPAQWLTTEKKRIVNAQPIRATATTENAGRYIVLAVDDYHLAASNLGYVKSALNKFIAEQMVAGDKIAVIATSGNVGLFQQFTGERDFLERAINRLTVQTKVTVDNTGGPRISEYQAELIEFGDPEALELAINEIARVEGAPSAGSGGASGADSRLGSGRQGGQSGGGQNGGQGSKGIDQAATFREMMVARAKSYARTILAQNANFTRATLDTLESVVRNLRPLPGRKLMVLLSDGFFLGGAGVYSQIYDTRRLADAATRAGVVIYSIDARGLVALPPGGDVTDPAAVDQTFPGAQIRIEQTAINAKRDGLGILAEETGGKLFFNNNDLNLGLQHILDANETYYVLAYEPPESRRDGRFHKIEIRIAGHPELKVRTRNGYFSPDEKAEKEEKLAAEKRQEKLKSLPPEKQAQELKAEKDKQLMTGLSSLFPLKDIPVEIAVDFVDVPSLSGATVNLHIDAANLSFEQIKGRQQTAIDVTGALFDERGKVATSFSERINLNVKPENLPQIIKQGFNYRRLAALQPGFYQARIAVREQVSGRLGSASGWVEVPNIKSGQLMLSGILLSESGKDAPQELPTADHQSTKGSEGYSLMPSSASRRFKSGSEMDFLLFVYNAKIEKSAVDLVSQTQIFSGSKLAYASPITKLQVPTDLDLQRVPYGARFSLKGLDAGQYELRLMVIDRLTKATAYRRVNFTIE